MNLGADQVMGSHRDAWAIETIKKIRELGESLGYITAKEELRVTRGWVDVSWRWTVPILKVPLYLLIVEVETSKADWPRVRSNAAKAVELKPLVYAHVFHPSVILTPEERSQLVAIHHGRHVLIFDGSTDFEDLLKQLARFDQRYVERTVFGFCFLRIQPSQHTQVIKALSKIEGFTAMYELLGRFDLLLVFSTENMQRFNQTVSQLREIEGVEEHSTFPAIRVLLEKPDKYL